MSPRKSTPISTPTYTPEIRRPRTTGQYAGLYEVIIRASITVEGKTVHRRSGTGVYVHKRDWNGNSKWGKWIKADVSRNLAIEKAIAEVKASDVFGVEVRLASPTFYNYALKYLQDNDLKPGTKMLVRNTIEDFTLFAGRDLLFSDINKTLVQGYVSSLASKGNNGSTIKTKIAALRMVVKSSEEFYGKLQALTGIKVRTVKTKKIALEPSEVELLQSADFKNPAYREITDLFLFCFYNWGMRAADAISFKVGQAGNGVLQYTMKKTGESLTIKMLDKAQVIYDRYAAGKADNDYLFPFYNVDKVAAYTEKYGRDEAEHRMLQRAVGDIDAKLERICRLVGIKKHITTHCARHTWARWADRTGVDRRIIQKGTGHKSLVTLEIYLSEIGSDEVDELNSRMFGQRDSMNF